MAIFHEEAVLSLLATDSHSCRFRPFERSTSKLRWTLSRPGVDPTQNASWQRLTGDTFISENDIMGPRKKAKAVYEERIA